MQTSRHRASPVVTLVPSVAKRLERMEALIIEMRHTQDVQLKRASGLQVRLDELTETIRVKK